MGEIIDKAKGKAKQVAGIVTDDSCLKSEGEMDEASGKAKGVINRVVEAAEDAAKKVKDAVKRI